MRPIGGKRSRNYTRPPSPFRRKSVPSSWSRLVPPTVDLRGEVQSLLAQPADSFPESAPRSAIKTLPPGAKLAVSRLWKRIRATMRRFLPGRAKGAHEFGETTRISQLAPCGAKAEWGVSLAYSPKPFASHLDQ
jgi:hypothetical protein